MVCQHPREERQKVYAGRATPAADREYCSLCGEIIFIVAVATRPNGLGS